MLIDGKYVQRFVSVKKCTKWWSSQKKPQDFTCVREEYMDIVLSDDDYEQLLL